MSFSVNLKYSKNFCSDNSTALKTLKLLLLRLTYTNQKQLPDTGPRRDTGVMSKPIQTLLAAYADNLVAAESLVEERVPLWIGRLWRVGCGTLYFFSRKKESRSSPQAQQVEIENLSEVSVPVYLASHNAAVVRADFHDFAIDPSRVRLHYDKFGSLIL